MDCYYIGCEGAFLFHSCLMEEVQRVYEVLSITTFFKITELFVIGALFIRLIHSLYLLYASTVRHALWS